MTDVESELIGVNRSAGAGSRHQSTGGDPAEAESWVDGWTDVKGRWERRGDPA